MGPLPSGRIFWILALAMMLAGPPVGWIAGRVVARDDDLKSSRRFDEIVREASFRVEKQVSILIEVLSGLADFYGSSELVTRKEFATFTHDSLERHPSIRALEWAPLVPPGLREAHERAVRRDGTSGYRIRAFGDPAWKHPPDGFDGSCPVVYVEPLAGNEKALGLDLASEPARRAAVLGALASKAVSISDPIVLVQGDGVTPGILAIKRLRSGDGVVVAVFEVEPLIKESLSPNSVYDFSANEMLLETRNAAGDPVVLYRHDIADPVGDPDRWRVTRVIQAGAKRWTMSVVPGRGFLARDTRRAVFYGAAVFVIWELLWLSLIALASLTKNRSLGRQERLNGSILGSMSEGVVLFDRAGRVLMSNPSAGRFVDPSSEMTIRSGLRLADGETPCDERSCPVRRVLSGDELHEEIFSVPDGETDTNRWLAVSGRRVLDDRLGDAGGLIVMRDISNRKRADEVVEKLFNAVEYTDDAVFITDRNGRIEYVNPAFERDTGWSRQDAVGQTPRILKSGEHPPEYYRDLWATILDGKVHRSTIVNRRRNGELYRADQTVTPMRDITGRISNFVSVVKDMTEFMTLKEQEMNMALAVGVQKRLYPDAPPALPGWEIAGAVFSADKTCGDYYDYVAMPDGGVAVIVGDVSGHGIGAAMVMMETRALLRSAIAAGRSLEDTVARTNLILCDDLDPSSFVTLIIAKLDPDTGRLSYVSAGHETCYVLGADGGIKCELRSTGAPLGIVPDAVYQVRECPALEEGDVAVLLTDGLAECQAHRDRFIEARTYLDVVRRNRRLGPGGILGALHEMALNFAAPGSFDDDITIVVCKAGARAEDRRAAAES